ncbi:MAG: potassium channel family protein [Clostridiaceae bacterium]
MAKKQFIVIGLGRFGSSVAKNLYKLGYEVMAVDKNEEIVQDISNEVTHAVQVDATDENNLKALGIRNFDVCVVTIGQDIQSSIMITLMVKELGVNYIISKANNELHAKVLEKIGADRVVLPERDMGVRVAHNLVSSNIMDYIELSPEYSIMELSPLEEWYGKSLKELSLRSRYGLNIIAIKNDGSINVNPLAEDIITYGSVVVAVGSEKDISKLDRAFNG